MPGGGGVIASNYLYNVAPQDGTTLAIITSSFANEQLFDNPQIRYDARKFGAIGRLLDTTSVLFFWHASPIKTLDDMLTQAEHDRDLVGERGAGLSAARHEPLLNTQFKAIPGYPSARDYVLATERGETDGGTSTYIGLSQLFSSYIEEKKLNILIQFATERDAEHAGRADRARTDQRPGGAADLPPARRQRRDRPLAVHHAQRAAGAARDAARRFPEDDRRSGISGGGGAAQAAAGHEDRRRDAEDRRRPCSTFPPRRSPRCGS